MALSPQDYVALTLNLATTLLEQGHVFEETPYLTLAGADYLLHFAVEHPVYRDSASMELWDKIERKVMLLQPIKGLKRCSPEYLRAVGNTTQLFAFVMLWMALARKAAQEEPIPQGVYNPTILKAALQRLAILLPEVGAFVHSVCLQVHPREPS